MVRLGPRLRPYWPQLKAVYTHATRVFAPVSVQLARLRGGYLPTGAVATMEQAAESTGGRCVLARPAETLVRPAAAGRPAGHPMFAASTQSVPRVAVAELPGGRVLGTHSAVITGDGRILQELSAYFGTSRPHEHPLFLNPFPGPPLEVPGRLGVLASRGGQNYYHFLVDVVARLGVFEQAGDVAPPDRWYVPAGFGWQREILGLLGLEPDQYLDSSAHPHVRAQTLVVPGLPATDVLNPPWVARWLRGRLLPGPTARPTESIYVTRGTSANNRVLTNEDEVVGLLRGRGFTVVSPATMSIAEQITLFAGARRIVAAHGAALTNLIFAGPGAAVIELLPRGEVIPAAYWTLAHGIEGLRYRYLLSSGPAAPPSLGAALVSDVVVDLDSLSGLLDELDAEQADANG